MAEERERRTEATSREFLEFSRRRFLAGGLAAGAGLFLAACSGDNGGSGDSGGTASGSTLEEPETKPDKIIMRSWGDPYSTGLGESAGKTFQDKTGIPVEFDLTDFTDIQTKVEQAVKAGERPPVDVVYTTTPHCFAASVREYAVPLDTTLVTNYADLSVAGKPDDGTENWVNIYTYTLPVIYRTDMVQFDGPISWEDLFDEKYRNSFVFNLDPNLMVWPIAKLLGLDPATDDMGPVFDKIETFQPQMAAIVENDTQLIETMNRGEASMSLALVGDGPVIDNGAWIVPNEGVSMSSDGVYVPTGLPEDVTYYAQVLVNELIAPENQSAFSEIVLAPPTNSKATLPAEMEGDPAFPFTDEEIQKYAIIVDNEVSVRNQDAWTEAFTAALVP